MRIFVPAVLLLLIISLGMAFATEKRPAQTIADLKTAIRGESTASAKYAAFATKAREEGFPKIALLFEAASKAEQIHANNHRAALGQLGETMGKLEPKFEVKSTRENLQSAIKGETYEITSMYPEFLRNARDGEVDIAVISFTYAYKTEQKHKALYEKALGALDAGDMNSMASQYQVCSTCGNTYEGEAPARCGISMTPKERFITIG